MNERERRQREQDYADPLCQFLGGDPVALGIFRALRGDDITTVDQLHEWYWQGTDLGPHALEPGYYIRDIKNIGPAAMERVHSKLNPEGRMTEEARNPE